MQEGSTLFGSKIAKLAIKAGVSVIALLILRGVVDSLPVLRNSPAISDSFLSDTLLSPLVIANAMIDTAVLAVMLTSGLGLARLIGSKGQRFAELGSIAAHITLLVVLIFAYKTYELPSACFFVSRTDLVSLNAPTAAPSGSFGDFIRAWGQVISQVNATAIQNASGDTLTSYQQLALADFRRPPNYYAWIFLVLLAIPVTGLVPLVYRNLDNMADLLSHGAAALHGSIGSGNPPPGPTVPPQADVAESMSLKRSVDKLIKLKTLLDAGAISKGDFENQKQRILTLPLQPEPNGADPEDFIRLKAIHEAGALTESEYETQKSRALHHI
ncbi:MAG TPA: SHOCT domain-containing protein [Terracidiphilus sp.]|nr:SHOCT domain-containing protein [Terracidiphilus sp.]